MQENNSQPQIGLYFLDVANAPPCFAQSASAISAITNVNFKPNASMEDMLFEAKSGKKCLLVLTIADRSDLSTVANGLFTIKKEIRERKVIVTVFMKFASDKVEELLSKSGCDEVLKFDLNSKAFLYKVRRYLKVLEQEDAMDVSDISVLGDKSTSNNAGKTLGSGSSRVVQGTAYQVELIDAWTGQDDFWLFRKKVYAKKYQSFWLIEIIGPSPAAGSWDSIGENRWQWKSRPGFEFFDTTASSWEFVGKEPQFSFVINRWAFVSETPVLKLVNAGKLIYSRFQLRDPSTLEVATNSEFARSIFQKIKETFDKDYTLAGEKKNYAKLEGVFGPNTEIPWADKTNSKDLSASDWNMHDTKPEAARDWTKHDHTEFLMGAEAMRDCGLKAELKNYEIEMLEYDEAQSTISVGLDAALVEYKEIVEVTIKSENLDLPKGLLLRGIVSHMQPQDELGQQVVVVLMLQNSKEQFLAIREAINKRQSEVFSFLKKAKGIEA
jgi:hypothetical protein